MYAKGMEKNFFKGKEKGFEGKDQINDCNQHKQRENNMILIIININNDIYSLFITFSVTLHFPCCLVNGFLLTSFKMEL